MVDDVVQNEQGTAATSILSGAESIAIQDLDICGPLHYVEHCECFFSLVLLTVLLIGICF